MSDEQIDESVLKADRYSRILAIFVALGVYLVASVLVGEVQFSMIVAAFVAIGGRIYIPYYASKRVSDSSGESVGTRSLPGSYHYGAVSGALVVGPLATIPIAMALEDTTVALGAGIALTVLIFVVLRAVLPE